MAIEKARLFERTRDRWPLLLTVRQTEGTPPFETTPGLVDLHRVIEASCDPAGEWTAEAEWTALANWAFHQALWALAEECGDRDLHREEVTFDAFDKCMRDNLKAECWAEERVEYDESPERFH